MLIVSLLTFGAVVLTLKATGSVLPLVTVKVSFKPVVNGPMFK